MLSTVAKYWWKIFNLREIWLLNMKSKNNVKDYIVMYGYWCFQRIKGLHVRITKQNNPWYTGYTCTRTMPYPNLKWFKIRCQVFQAKKSRFCKMAFTSLIHLTVSKMSLGYMFIEKWQLILWVISTESIVLWQMKRQKGK